MDEGAPKLPGRMELDVRLSAEHGGRLINVRVRSPENAGAEVDGDVAMLYYRKDAIENPEHRRKFKEKTGRELGVPRTWEEFRQVAEFFTGWAWGPSGKPGYGFQTSTWDRS